MVRPYLLALSFALLVTPNGLQAQETFLGKSAADWSKQLKSVNPGDRRNAAFALGKMGSKALPFILDMKLAAAGEKDSKVRESVIFALGDICRDSPSLRGDSNLEQICLDALKEDDPLVRRSAAYTLGCLGGKSALVRSTLDAALKDDNALVRQNVAWALEIGAGLGADGALVLPSLRKALSDGDSFVKRDAASALLLVNGPDTRAKVRELVPDLLPLCSDANSEVRRAALTLLVRLVNSTDKSAALALRKALEDTDLENKRNAALALTNIGGPDALPALPILLDAIKSDDPDLRRQAVLAIRNIGRSASSAVNLLIQLLSDKDAQVRNYAILSLGGIGAPAEPAVPAVVERLLDAKESRELRYNCLMTLRAIGSLPLTKEAIPAIIPLLRDAKLDSYVRLRIPYFFGIHGGYLKSVDGLLDAFVQVMKEPVRKEFDHRLLRYESASNVAWIWQADAPETALDVLYQGLFDTSIKILGKTESGVGGTSSENASGKSTVTTKNIGDGRILWVEAISRIGVARYSKRADIMKQLRVLADDTSLYEPLRKRCAELLKAAEKGGFMTDANASPIRFFSKANEFFELSNFSAHGFELDGVFWPTVEHYFQAQKFPSEPAHQEKIRNARSPKDAKSLGRSKEVPLRSDWEEAKDDVMRRALRGKFTTHGKLRELLLGTSERELIENSPSDYYWGCGQTGSGKNRLGQLLMELRIELRKIT